MEVSEKRERDMVTIRPTLFIGSNGEKTEIEQFQNAVLRPILKLQHTIIISLVTDSISGSIKKNDKENKEAFSAFIKRHLSSTLPLQNQLIGLVVGIMTQAELINYLSEKKEFNRRIKQMIVERVVSTF
ncbi:MAG: hypothetical protein AB8B61_10070 [Cyclobacteriaceae bacterium]